MPSDDLIPVSRDDFERVIAELDRIGDCDYADGPKSFWDFFHRLRALAADPPKTPPQPDPTQLIIEYVEAASDFDALMETYTRLEELDKANTRRYAAERAIFDFADSRKGE